VLLQFYSTPTDGSSLASIASLALRLGIWSNSQVENLSSNIEKHYLGVQTRAWQDSGFDIPSYCAYEEQPTLGVTVVNFESATALCNKSSAAVESNHVDIVKPTDSESRSYLIFKANFKEAFARSSSHQQNTSSLVNNSAGGAIGSFTFLGNTVIGSSTILDNSGSVGEALVDGNHIHSTAKDGTAAIIDNSGRIGETAVSNNYIQLSKDSSPESDQDRLRTNGQASLVSMSGSAGDIWFDHVTTDRFGTLVGSSDRVGSMFVTDSTINLEGTSVERAGPNQFGQSGQIGSLSVYGSSINVPAE
jgi:hypothetical protein